MKPTTTNGVGGYGCVGRGVCYFVIGVSLCIWQAYDVLLQGTGCIWLLAFTRLAFTRNDAFLEKVGGAYE